MECKQTYQARKRCHGSAGGLGGWNRRLAHHHVLDGTYDMPPCPEEPNEGPILAMDQTRAKLPGRERRTYLQEASSSLVDGRPEIWIVLHHVADERIHELKAMTPLRARRYQYGIYRCY